MLCDGTNVTRFEIAEHLGKLEQLGSRQMLGRLILRSLFVGVVFQR